MMTGNGLIDGGIGGLIGGLLAIFGINHRLNALEKGKVDMTACAECKDKNDHIYEELKGDIKEIKEDIKVLLSRNS